MWKQHFLLAVCLILVGLDQQAFASNQPSNNLINDAESGVFMMRAVAGNTRDYTPATLLNTDVDIKVSGPVAHVTVKQSFFNQGQAFAEGVYVFPLPDKSAVNGMQMRIGQRLIVGDIKEKSVAKKIYQQAKRAGKRAALVEQQRPNLFTSSVANIAPGEAIEVTITYVETLQLDGNHFSLRFPMTLTPRFMPSPDSDAIHSLDAAPTNQPFVTRFIEGLKQITPPQVSANSVAPELRNPVKIRAYIDAGQSIENLISPYHSTHNTYDGKGYAVNLRMPQVPMDRDFVLHWDIANGEQSSAAFYTENIAGQHYGLLMLMPPQHESQQAAIDREVIFIIDTSGSMGGESIRQAKQSLLQALQRLQPRDSFNVIEFNSTHSQLFQQTRSASAVNIQSALNFVRNVQAGGGTQMQSPLHAALTMPSNNRENLRQVVFITDGAVGNENALFALTHQLLGNSRLFTVGIGSAPNSYFMRKAAEFGKGSFTHIGSTTEVDEKMRALFSKLENPVLRDIRIDFPQGMTAEMWPAKIPDLYKGEPVLVAMKFNTQPNNMTVSGLSGPSGNWQREIDIEQSQQHHGTSTLWARNKIAALMDRITRGESEQSIKPGIVKVAVDHKLLSRYTSFVAVDKTPVRNPNTPLKTSKVANLTAHGSSGGHASYPATASGVQLWWLMAILLMLAAALQARLNKIKQA
jgi:Ca-activated chloride channel family protein